MCKSSKMSSITDADIGWGIFGTIFTIALVAILLFTVISFDESGMFAVAICVGCCVYVLSNFSFVPLLIMGLLLVFLSTLI